MKKKLDTKQVFQRIIKGIKVIVKADSIEEADKKFSSYKNKK